MRAKWDATWPNDTFVEQLLEYEKELGLAVTEMKVSNKKGTGFYIRAANSFLKGIEAQEASEGKGAVEAKAPVDELKISGLGEAINVAVSVAARIEADKVGTIVKVETQYPEMPGGRGCAQIAIIVKRTQ